MGQGVPSASLIIENREERLMLQRELNHLEKWADRNLVNFYKAMCKVLHLWKNKIASMHQDMLEAS